MRRYLRQFRAHVARALGGIAAIECVACRRGVGAELANVADRRAGLRNTSREGGVELRFCSKCQ